MLLNSKEVSWYSIFLKAQTQGSVSSRPMSGHAQNASEGPGGLHLCQKVVLLGLGRQAQDLRSLHKC